MSKENDSFGDRMKMFEMAEAGRRLMPQLPIIARIDGQGFSKFTRGLNRPYDERLSKLMVATTKYLVEKTEAQCGYTQSDEITLGWRGDNREMLYSGRISKLTSALAAWATGFFNKKMPEFLPEEWQEKIATFDCRVWNMPNLAEGANAFLWREQDATKNSISMAARAYYSHKAIKNKKGPEMQEMLWQKGINWNDYPAFFKRGTYIQRRLVQRPFTPEEVNQLPEKHDYFRNPQLIVERTECIALELPPLKKVLNRAKVIFNGHDPVISEENEKK